VPPVIFGLAPPATATDAAEPSLLPAGITPKVPAKLPSKALAEPIRQPAFPSVDDDPFALPPPSTAVPQPPRPIDDDPFAPLPSSAPPAKPSTVPLTTKPTSKLADSLLPSADGQLPLREWIDDSGHFRVKARLILILDGKVRLLKETGRTTTVPVDRLSTADRQYIAQVTARYGNDLSALDQFAAR